MTEYHHWINELDQRIHSNDSSLWGIWVHGESVHLPAEFRSFEALNDASGVQRGQALQSYSLIKDTVSHLRPVKLRFVKV